MMKKRLLALLLLLCLVLPVVGMLPGCSAIAVKKLYVYNWGEYMALGKYDSTDINDAFETWYEEAYGEPVEVVYSVFSSNEEMYAKMQNGSSKMDVIFPSEYMIERLMAENLLAPLNFDNIGAYEECIEDRFQNLATAPYCVPYTYGYIGIIYDASIEEDIFDENGEVSWRVLWNEIPSGRDLSGQILTFNNSRDAFGLAQFTLNYEKNWELGNEPGTDLYVNTESKDRWYEAYLMLSEQKDNLQAYVMDEIYNKMQGGAALMAPYYAGDYFVMADVNENLCFTYTKEGTNFFYDAMCVPAASRNQELAEIYINFLLGGDDGEHLDLAIENAAYIGYSSPNIRVTTNPDYLACMVEDYGEESLSILYPECDTEYLLSLVDPYIAWRDEQGEEYDTADYEGTLPKIEDFARTEDAPDIYPYANLSPEAIAYQNRLWENLKLESAPVGDVYIISAVITVLLLAGGIYLYLRGRHRRRFY